ncbi:DUF6542 domain-containing protein [Mycobacterium sp. 155]|uniref:DUF6542 domain-containing protein n=1 Tax=Mycobacterium sp. 155 TaxID=1157943 RepID=UPI0004779E97|nr:DUF6542 domain-containing protein [Mycobacterium sp. 155]
MSGQRAQSAVPADHRSVYPKWPGLPWWGAVLLAVTATAIGFAFDAGSGDRELSTVFAVCYALGCLAAVLAVRQSGVFTAVIQPPLILFVAVPGSYFLFHGGQLGGVKDVAINCGYPLIERFPLMLFTAAAVLLIGLARWYFALMTRDSANKTEKNETSKTRKPIATLARTGIVAAVTAKLSGLLVRKPVTRRSPAPDSDDEPTPRRRRADRSQQVHRQTRAGRPDRAERPHRTEPPRRRRPEATEDAAAERRATKRATPPRSRPSRPLLDEFGEPIAERPRRARAPRASEPPLVPPADARRRVRAQPREPRKQPPPERRTATAHDRQPRRRRFDDYQPFEDPYEAPPTRNGNASHHPVSRVRYRGAEDEDGHKEYRSRRRPSPDRDNTWEYDG